MRKLLILMLVALPLVASAQWDTTAHRRLHPRTEPLVGAALFSTGTLISIRPELHDREISLYDKFSLADATRLHFDDYLQFAPLAAAFALNLAGFESEHNLGQMALLAATSCLLGLAATETGKLLYQVERPDGNGYSSFPSGHTFGAFCGAEMVRREYGSRYPWVTYVGYGVATLVGIMRMYNSRHWFSDVLGGVGMAILSVHVSYSLWGANTKNKVKLY